MAERLRLGDMLVGAGLVTEAHVSEALDAQKELGLRLGETLVQLGYVSEGEMTQVLSNQLSLPWVDLYHVDFSRELLDHLPAELADRFSVVPVYVRQVRKQGETLYLGMVDPLDGEALQAAADASGLPVKPMVASPSDVRDAIRVYYLGLPPLAEEEAEEGEATVLLVDEDEAPSVPGAGRVDEPPDEAPPILPSLPPPSRPAPAFRTLTLLDGTTVRLPVAAGARPASADEEERPRPRAGRSLTTRDLIHALRARAAGEDVSDVIDEDDVEAVLATLLSVLLKKGIVADWEFLTEWKKHRRKA